MSVAEQKARAAAAAVELVSAGMTVGLGTGSTAAAFVDALGARGLDIRCVATSTATERQARSLGMRLAQLDEVDRIDLTVDGADEIGPGLALIKGGGGALLREKLVWTASARCVVVADAGKPVARLGAFPLPIEVTPFGHLGTARRIAAVLDAQGVAAAPVLRHRDGRAFVTDGGNLIYDASCGAIPDPQALAAALKSVTGVVDHGLFLGLADRALIGLDAEVRALSAEV